MGGVVPASPASQLGRNSEKLREKLREDLLVLDEALRPKVIKKMDSA
jgi:hypothetical protein